MKVLSIVSSAYRATLEEQDDTVLWFTQALTRAGAEIDVLLRSGASNYVVEAQGPPPLAIGGRAQRNAPDINGQVRDLADHGADVFVIEEDLAIYGLDRVSRLEGARTVPAAGLADLISQYDAVWHW
jgi:hypothetical protein